MEYEVLSVGTVKKLREYEILKRFLKKEIEKENYLSTERVLRFIEILEEKENENE